MAANADEEVAGFIGREEARPLHAECLPAGYFSGKIAVRERHVGLGAGDEGFGIRFTARTSSHAFVVVGLEAGLAVGGCEKAVGDGCAVGAKELGSGNEGD